MKTGWPRSISALALCILIVVTSFAGCASTQGGAMFDKPGQAAMICGAGGAVAGGAIGGAVSRDWRGALIGAAAGALVAATTCFAIGEYRSRQVRTYEQTRDALNYRPAQGDVVQVTHYAITPTAVSPGSQASFDATYYVMTPTPDQDVVVNETRIVKMYDPSTAGYKELGRATNPVTVKPGTRQADGKWDIRSGVAEGKYLVVFEVAKQERMDAKELPLTVTKNQAVLGASANRVAEVTAEGAKAASPSTTGSRPAAQPAKTPQTTTGSLSALGEKSPGAAVAAVPASGSTKPTYFLASKVVGRGNVREGPGPTHKIVGEIHSAERFLIVDRVMTGQRNDTLWYKIRLDSGTEGWVAAALGEETRE